MQQIGVTSGGNKKDWIGIASETKPTDNGPGSTFTEVDTATKSVTNVYIYDGTD